MKFGYDNIQNPAITLENVIMYFKKITLPLSLVPNIERNMFFFSFSFFFLISKEDNKNTFTKILLNRKKKNPKQACPGYLLEWEYHLEAHACHLFFFSFVSQSVKFNNKKM